MAVFTGNAPSRPLLQLDLSARHVLLAPDPTLPLPLSSLTTRCRPLQGSRVLSSPSPVVAKAGEKAQHTERGFITGHAALCAERGLSSRPLLPTTRRSVVRAAGGKVADTALVTDGATVSPAEGVPAVDGEVNASLSEFVEVASGTTSLVLEAKDASADGEDGVGPVSGTSNGTSGNVSPPVSEISDVLPTPPSSAFPLPKFMIDQVNLLEQATLKAAAEEAAQPRARQKRRAAPKKLPKEDKASAPWGWDGSRAQRGSDASLETLEKWLRTRGLPEQKLSLQLVKEGGRGLVARSNVGKGETLLSVPASLMMTAEKVYESSPAGPLLKQLSVPEWPALAIFLLLEAGKGEASQWSTYIATLPRTPPCILQWSPEEVDILLKGSPVQRKAIECIADVTSTFRDLDNLLFSKHRDVFPEELFSLGLFKWAFAILFSRLVRLKSLGGQLALVPWADMLNHRCEVESFLDFDDWKKAVCLKTDRAYDTGKEVFASYGPRSNGSLLLAYGVVPKTRNPHDATDISLGFDPADPMLPAKAAALAQHKLSAPVSFPLQMEGWPVQLLAFLRLSSLDPSAPEVVIQDLARQVASEEAGVAKLFKRGGKGGAKSTLPLSVEIRARELLVAACQVALDGYPTSLQEDEALLSGVLEDYLEDDGEQRVRVLAATALKVSERRILLKTDFVARAELRELRAEAAASSEGKVKIDLGNNLGGDRRSANPLDRFLKRIVRP